MSIKTGSASKITGVTPKLYIKDDGTTYTTGEDFNSLWSANSGSGDLSNSTATGYANVGHWKFNELEGTTVFNQRHRNVNNLAIREMRRGKDAVGTFAQFILENNDQPSVAKRKQFCMIGDGAQIVEASNFKNFVKSNPIGNTNLGSSGNFNGKLHFDIWANFRAIATAGEIQTILYFHNEADSNGFDRVLELNIKNNSGSPEVILNYINNAEDGYATFTSTTAGSALYPSGISSTGGLHQISLVFDREETFGSGGSTGIYIDGVKYSGTASGTMEPNAVDCNTSGFIGCRIAESNTDFTADQSSSAPTFDQHFTGKIYMAQLSNDASGATAARLTALANIKFDVPRGPAKVDFSDRFEVKGPNVLQEIGSLVQKMETQKGTFTINLSSIKVKN
tara:strand:- start:452 stop:1633 length:1182 start_codon:yes stop_codon:yes gene_type:complete